MANAHLGHGAGLAGGEDVDPPRHLVAQRLIGNGVALTIPQLGAIE